MEGLNWSISQIPDGIGDWLDGIEPEASPEFRQKVQGVAMVLACQDGKLPDFFSHLEPYWEGLAVPVAHRQLELEREFAEKEAAWAARLNEMQDGIERAVEWLNNASEIPDASTVHVESCEHALAELNKVL